MIKNEIIDLKMRSLAEALDSFGDFDLRDAFHGHLSISENENVLFNGYVMGEGKLSRYNKGFEFIRTLQIFFDEFNINSQIEFSQPLFHENHLPRLYIALYPCKNHKLSDLNQSDYSGFLKSDDIELLHQRYSLMKEAWVKLEEYLLKIRS